MLQSTYRNNLTEPAPKPFLPQSGEFDMEAKKDYIVISSRDRDLAQYANPAQFHVNLPREYRNVKCLRVIQGSFPSVSQITSLPFVYLDIPEVNFIHVAGLSRDVTAVLQLKNIAPTNFLSVDSPIDRFQNPFSGLKDKLNRLTVNLLSPDGTTLNWATETTTASPANQWYVTLEITTVAPKPIRNVNYGTPF